MSGLLIFPTVAAALAAGYIIVSPIPDSEGFIRAKILTSCGWAMALCRVGK